MPTANHPPRRTSDEQIALEATLADLFQRRISFNQLLGLEVVCARSPHATIHFKMRPELVGHYLYGRLHGGVIASALDAMGSLALMVALGDKHTDESTAQVLHRFARMGTVDLRVDYLRPAVGESFIATAEVTRLGGRIGSTQMRLTNDLHALCATAAATYVIS